MSYPQAFEKFLRAEDPELQLQIEEELASLEAARKKELEAKVQAVKDVQLQRESAVGSGSAVHKLPARMRRSAGQQMAFFVFQGDIFELQAQGGYLWAPKYTVNGEQAPHWDRLMDVRRNDIIFHGSNGYIRAVSRAGGECYDAEKPAEQRHCDQRDNDGRRVDCRYYMLEMPVCIDDFREDNIRLSAAKYSAFDKNGYGNMGYLYALNDEHTRIFMKAAAEKNEDIAALDFVKEFLDGID